MEHLLFFYGETCSHCKAMEKVVAQLETTGIKVTRLEVENNKENENMFIKLDVDPCCEGVPFFVNTKTGCTICGEVEYDELKNWAEGK